MIQYHKLKNKNLFLGEYNIQFDNKSGFDYFDWTKWE